MVAAGDASGAQLEGSDRPVEGVQEQVAPPDPVSGVELPRQIAVVPDALATGVALTVSTAAAEVIDCEKESVTTTS